MSASSPGSSEQTRAKMILLFILKRGGVVLYFSIPILVVIVIPLFSPVATTRNNVTWEITRTMGQNPAFPVVTDHIPEIKIAGQLYLIPMFDEEQADLQNGFIRLDKIKTLAEKLINHEDEAFRQIWESFTPEERKKIEDEYRQYNKPGISAILISTLDTAFRTIVANNKILFDAAYLKKRLAQKRSLMGVIRKFEPLKLRKDTLVRFNRLLLEDTFPDEINRTVPPSLEEILKITSEEEPRDKDDLTRMRNELLRRAEKAWKDGLRPAEFLARVPIHTSIKEIARLQMLRPPADNDYINQLINSVGEKLDDSRIYAIFGFLAARNRDYSDANRYWETAVGRISPNAKLRPIHLPAYYSQVLRLLHLPLSSSYLRLQIKNDQNRLLALHQLSKRITELLRSDTLNTSTTPSHNRSSTMSEDLGTCQAYLYLMLGNPEQGLDKLQPNKLETTDYPTSDTLGQPRFSMTTPDLSVSFADMGAHQRFVVTERNQLRGVNAVFPGFNTLLRISDQKLKVSGQQYTLPTPALVESLRSSYISAKAQPMTQGGLQVQQWLNFPLEDGVSLIGLLKDNPTADGDTLEGQFETTYEALLPPNQGFLREDATTYELTLRWQTSTYAPIHVAMHLPDDFYPIELSCPSKSRGERSKPPHLLSRSKAAASLEFLIEPNAPSGPWLLCTNNIANIDKLIRRFKTSPDPLSKYLISAFPKESRDFLKKYSPGQQGDFGNEDKLKDALITGLNKSIEEGNLYDVAAFKPFVKELGLEKPDEVRQKSKAVNRLLIDTAYQEEFRNPDHIWCEATIHIERASTILGRLGMLILVALVANIVICVALWTLHSGQWTKWSSVFAVMIALGAMVLISFPIEGGSLPIQGPTTLVIGTLLLCACQVIAPCLVHFWSFEVSDLKDPLGLAHALCTQGQSLYGYLHGRLPEGTREQLKNLTLPNPDEASVSPSVRQLLIHALNELLLSGNLYNDGAFPRLQEKALKAAVDNLKQSNLNVTNELKERLDLRMDALSNPIGDDSVALNRRLLEHAYSKFMDARASKILTTQQGRWWISMLCLIMCLNLTFVCGHLMQQWTSTQKGALELSLTLLVLYIALVIALRCLYKALCPLGFLCFGVIVALIQVIFWGYNWNIHPTLDPIPFHESWKAVGHFYFWGLWAGIGACHMKDWLEWVAAKVRKSPYMPVIRHPKDPLAPYTRYIKNNERFLMILEPALLLGILGILFAAIQTYGSMVQIVH